MIAKQCSRSTKHLQHEWTEDRPERDGGPVVSWCAGIDVRGLPGR